MSIPGTVAGLLVLVLAVLPGMPGDLVYRAVVGVSWREKDLPRILRLLLFSVLGIVSYSLVAAWLGFYQPDYVVPSTFTDPEFSASSIPRLGLAFVGHLAASALVGAAAAGGLRLLSRFSPLSAHRDAWDHFIRQTVSDHWVLLGLTNGDAYAGLIDHADVATEPEYRDVILEEPYKFDTESGRFVPTYNQYLFVLGSDIASIAVVHGPSLDTRIVAIAKSPFQEGNASVRGEEAARTTP
jgi:hypothetical protein